MKKQVGVLSKKDLEHFEGWLFDQSQDAEDKDEHGKDPALAGDAQARRVGLRLLKIYRKLVGYEK